MDIDIYKNEFVPNSQSFSKLSYNSWKNNNPKEAQAYEAYRDAILAGGSPTPPNLATKFGKMLVAAGKLVQQSSTSPPIVNPPPVDPPPPTTPTSAPVNMKSGDTVSFASLKGPGQVGISAVSVQNVKVIGCSVDGFRSPNDADAAGIRFKSVSAGEIANCKIINCGNSLPNYCNGALGIGASTGLLVHDNEVDTDIGYAVKSTGSPLKDCDIYNNKFTVRSTKCSSWNTLCVEIFNTDAVNCKFRNNILNGVLSLTDASGGPLSGGYRWLIANNQWNMSGGTFYAIELDQNSCEICYNYIKGGWCIAFNAAGAKSGIKIHHNVFDGQVGPQVNGLAFDNAYSGIEFYKNTVVLRNGVSESFFRNIGDAKVYDNVFFGTGNFGDQLKNIPQAVLDHNSFYNITPHGTNQLGSAKLTLSGWPDGYKTTLAGVGAFADGDFVVGPA